MAAVVQAERPDLGEQRAALVAQQNEFTIKLQALGDGLLQMLAEAEGDLTENEELIESLRYEEPPEPEEPLLELPPAKKRRFAGRWAEDEEASLKELVKELGDNAWDQVAERLGTGRSARGAEQHWEVMRGTHAFARKRKGPPPKAPPKRSPKKEPEPEPARTRRRH